MKIIPHCSALIAFLLFVRVAATQSTTIIGDIHITNKNGVLYCDSLICPAEAVTCSVSKRNDPDNNSQLIRIRRCLTPNRDIALEQTIYEENKYNNRVNVNVVSGGSFSSSNVIRELTPEEQRQLEETLRQTQERIQLQLAEQQKKLNEGLKRMQEQLQSQLQKNVGLRDRILADVQNNLNNAYWYG